MSPALPAREAPVSNRRRVWVRRGAWAATALVALGWLVFFRPAVLGGPVTYVIVYGESMQPTLHGGDLVIARQAGAYAIGDVITYRVPAGQPGAGAHVIHRIVGGDADGGFVTQGDNRDGADLWRPTPADIAGKTWLAVPRAGKALGYLQTPVAMASLAALLVFWLIAGGSRHRDSGADEDSSDESAYSHSIVPGGLDVMS